MQLCIIREKEKITNVYKGKGKDKPIKINKQIDEQRMILVTKKNKINSELQLPKFQFWKLKIYISKTSTFKPWKIQLLLTQFLWFLS